MRSKVLSFIRKESLIEKGDSIVIALSGGADSVSLFHFLLSIKDEYDLTLYAFHLNHMLRGEDADNDMEFVRKLCDNSGVRLYIYKEDIDKIAKEKKISTETAGRDIRYMYLDQIAKENRAKIATAHTLSDNAETMIFNISRGTSLKGLAGIPPKRDNIIRPLLCVTRSEIEKYCDDNNLSYVTDSTNLEDIYVRNRIRHNVIPVLEDISGDLYSSIERLSDIVRESYGYILSVAETQKENARLDYGYDASKISGLDDAVRHQVYVLILKEYGIPYDYDTIRSLDTLIENESQIDVSKDFMISSKQGILRVIKKGGMEFFRCPFRDYENIEIYDQDELKSLSDDEKKHLVDMDKISDDAVIRNREAGDTFTFAKRNVSKSLKKLMIEEKIPSEMRDGLLVLYDKGKILYCEKIGASKYGFISRNTKKAVKINKLGELK